MKIKITIKKRDEKGIEKSIEIISKVSGDDKIVGDLLCEMEREANASGKIRVWVEEA